MNHRQKLFANGSLIINELNEITDNGQYSCQAKAAETIAFNHVQLQIKGELCSTLDNYEYSLVHNLQLKLTKTF